jgi:phenylpropionate dioxygenase-like ring-hydroxylating dioxygenase large terminal subunit
MLVTRQPVLRRFWYPVLPLERLDTGPQPFTLLGEDIVLWKQRDGTPAAVKNRCCHRTARLSKGFVDGDWIVCGYHGWTYDASGRCVRIPQHESGAIPERARVPGYRCRARYGYAWVALDEPLKDMIDVPEDARGYRRLHQYCEPWQAGALRLMENSFDAAHFAFVHRGTFGVFGANKPDFFQLTENADGFEAETHLTIRNPPESHRITGTSAATTRRHFRNQWHLPFQRRLGLYYPNGLEHIILTAATPIDDARIQVIQWAYRNDDEASCPATEINAWDLRVVLEDKDILEAVDPDAPVDITRRSEENMQSDKPGIIIRRRLLELLRAHGEEEVYRGKPAGAGAAR